MKHKYLLIILFIIITCDTIDRDLANQCNPAFIFKESFKEDVNFQMIGDQVFQPYCSPCHSTSTYLLNPNTRIGYIPLDDQIKNELSSNQLFLSEFSKYINFQSPKESILIKSILEGDVLRADNGDYIDYREPRFRCYLPDDFVDGLVWWIENSEGNVQNLFK